MAHHTSHPHTIKDPAMFEISKIPGEIYPDHPSSKCKVLRLHLSSRMFGDA
jgi:hypothetical protein